MASKKINELETRSTLDGLEYVPVGDATTGVAYKTFMSSVVYVGIQGGVVFPILGSFAYQTSSVNLTGNTNNLSLPENTLMRLNSTGNFDLTGIVPAVTAATNSGRLIYLLNVGSNSISLRNEDVLSTASNRFVTHNGSHITLGPGHLVMALYDGNLSRWRIWDLT